MQKQMELVVDRNPKSPVAEAYRMLRTNVQFLGVEKSLKDIVITSARMEEGKTTTAANLAISFANLGSRVILVDGDLRRPKVAKLFDILSDKGLSEILIKNDDYQDYVVESGIDNLDIITSGFIPPNPSELFTSNAMKELLDKLREDYDMIIIDSPPVNLVTDATILSTLVSGTIIVASSGKVEIQELKQVVNTLKKVNANLLGIILNRVNKKKKYGGYYY